ncbi:MAG: acyl carrier protein [Magnetococcales bacterium]|nr:acyl carrier protein [Magnetococcales bacterium]
MTDDGARVAERIRARLLTDFPPSQGKLDDDDDLLEEVFVDSMRILEASMFLEFEFGISLTRQDITGDNFQTIAAMTAMVIRRSSADR